MQGLLDVKGCLVNLKVNFEELEGDVREFSSPVLSTEAQIIGKIKAFEKDTLAGVPYVKRANP